MSLVEVIASKTESMNSSPWSCSPDSNRFRSRLASLSRLHKPCDPHWQVDTKLEQHDGPLELTLEEVGCFGAPGCITVSVVIVRQVFLDHLVQIGLGRAVHESSEGDWLVHVQDDGLVIRHKLETKLGPVFEMDVSILIDFNVWVFVQNVKRIDIADPRAPPRGPDIRTNVGVKRNVLELGESTEEHRIRQRHEF
ncbi:hypothetical protein OGAPHI_004632 [Ogataea philodendri]|uniref:Uncharacterized protein n=1 Tax=Ogataea philodendri TaxID=1378263 RepID=A0A9P8T3R7_9ASCO|nr:uncharacterized protein OGAPHI_004632 [Ogataea philodendri]KAH3664280.1 hypothetical protein OGAPHI_004632 [Ogataea philodendri]